MSVTKDQARSLLKQHELRATAPRMALLVELSKADSPVSHTEVLARLGESDWDQATIYRNLIKLTEHGLTRVVSRAEGMDRYEFIGAGNTEEHHHPHFVCEDCKQITCLPVELTWSMKVDDGWDKSVQDAHVQLSGHCPDCISTR